MTKIRKPAVAGQFYPDDPGELKALLQNVYEEEKGAIDLDLAQKNLIGGVSPHAGYMFSAYQAVHLFEIIRYHATQYDTLFIINPNHSGMGNDMAYDSNEYWESPLGNVEVDQDFASQLELPVSNVEEKREHSGEVMLPMLQYFLDYPFKIAPVTITRQNHSNALWLAQAIYQANQKLNKKILIIASSDFSHFVSPKIGQEKDQYVLDRIKQLDAPGVEQVIREKHISVCGYGPIMTLMEYARMVSGKPEVEILKRGSSGDVIPSNEVVDYVSIMFYEA
ncbi:MAG: AmmeMemoRadiSam system protein B [Bacteroidales bacterium]|nr:AmmeMemoRadiSam system protein B [Bacteroidales bacterium]